MTMIEQIPLARRSAPSRAHRSPLPAQEAKVTSPPLGAPRKLLSPEEIIEREIEALWRAYKDATSREWQGAILRGLSKRALLLADMQETGIVMLRRRA